MGGWGRGGEKASNFPPFPSSGNYLKLNAQQNDSWQSSRRITPQDLSELMTGSFPPSVWFSSTEFFKSLLLSFSPNLDEFNPDIPEWRQDVGRVIKKALLQVSDFHFLCPFPASAASLHPPPFLQLFLLSESKTGTTRQHIGLTRFPFVRVTLILYV